MKYYLIYNPTARSGRSKIEFKKIIEILKDRNIDFDYALTTKKDEAIDIASGITKNKTDVIVAVGGDGTMGEVITGLMRQSRQNRPILGVLHIGTSPDFPRYHGIPIQTDEATDFLLKAKPALIDIGKVAYHSLINGEITTSYFGCNVNIGLGPQIASKYGNRYRTILGDFGGTLLATLVSLAFYKNAKASLMVDDNKIELNNLINLTAGKDPYLASGMRVPVNICANDGKMFYLSLQSKSKIKLLGQLWRLYKGNILDFPGAKFCRAQKIVIESEDLSLVEFDGDVRGCLPAMVEIMPCEIPLLKVIS